MNYNILIIAPIIGIIAILFGLYKASYVGKQEAGDERMKEISGYIHEGAMAFLQREYKALVVFVAVLAIVLFFAINWQTAVCFIVGAIFSVLAGYIGMNTATKANVRTAQAAHTHGMGKALDIAFSGGAVMGLVVVGLGIVGLSLIHI